MKIVILLTLVSTIASARQYIQCGTSTSWDRAVINLDGDQSTLFMTSGVHEPNPIQILKDLYLDYSDNDVHVFKTEGVDVKEEITIENQYLNQALSYFPVNLKLIRVDSGYEQNIQMGCFSSIH